MKDISEVLGHRDKLYTDQTTVVFDRLKPVFKGIYDYLSYADPSYAPGIFIWLEAKMFDGGDLLMLVGRVEYEIGATFVMEGHSVKITEQNKPYYVRTLRIGIPFSIVNQLDATATFDFLHSLRTAIEEDTARLIEEAQRVVDTEITEEFDLDELSDEQRDSLMHYELGKLN